MLRRAFFREGWKGIEHSYKVFKKLEKRAATGRGRGLTQKVMSALEDRYPHISDRPGKTLSGGFGSLKLSDAERRANLFREALRNHEIMARIRENDDEYEQVGYRPIAHRPEPDHTTTPRHSKLKTALKVLGAGAVLAAGAGAAAGYFRRRESTMGMIKNAASKVHNMGSEQWGGRSGRVSDAVKKWYHGASDQATHARKIIPKEVIMDRMHKLEANHPGYLKSMAVGAVRGLRHPIRTMQSLGKHVYKRTLGGWDD